jgi:hypothetical protein
LIKWQSSDATDFDSSGLLSKARRRAGSLDDQQRKTHEDGDDETGKAHFRDAEAILGAVMQGAQICVYEVPTLGASGVGYIFHA